MTSNDAMIRRLGGKRWKTLHSVIYLCAIAGVVHFCWLVKKDLTIPIIFSILLGLLLGVRFFFRILDARKRKLNAHRLAQHQKKSPTLIL
jgi:sulfoxide reductase heme-binding subunit YedZ